MVITWLHGCGTTGALAAAGQEDLPPEARVTALMAFLGLVLLGIFLVLGVVLAIRWIRRRVRDEDDRPGRGT